MEEITFTQLSGEEIRSILREEIELALEKQKPKPASEFIGIEEAMVFLGLAKQTIYGLTSKGDIPHYKQHKLYFKPSELTAWIESGRQVPPLK